MEEEGGWESRVTEELASFLAERDSVYLATANGRGQPYVQHRGGPRGFLRVLDDRTLAFADYGGNKQYITLGNLAENDQAFLFAMDYAARRRVKVWGRAKVVEGDAALLARVSEAQPGPPDGGRQKGKGRGSARARGERVILFTVEAWDVNCPQHIPVKLDAADVQQALDRLQLRVRELEEENARLRRATSEPARP
jgi:predicted pyridoxine 5'-phosphate oxidase superfamily flavin-nucleotide-binding protein